MPLFYVVWTALYCGGIFLASESEIPSLPLVHFPFADKLAHVVVYGGLAALVALGLRRSRRAHSARVLLWMPFFFATLYGGLDEVHQSYVPARSADPGDAVANGVGALCAALFLLVVAWRIPLRAAAPWGPR